jgi:GAF domain-containing protein
LIADLFEELHELHFMRDITAGCEFLLALLRRVLPSEGIVLHVFDINSSAFVVVRTHPRQPKALLYRTADDDGLFRQVMHQSASVRFNDAGAEDSFRGGLWPVLDVQPRFALCGPVKHGGRYLGLIQLVNPLGDTPFHDSEMNALDYICQQFADFVASRPVVLEVDTVLPPA